MALRKPQTKTVFIGIALFILFLFFSFPFQNLKGFIFGKVYKETGITIVADDLYPTFFGWPGIGLTNVEISAPVMGKDFDLACKKAVFRIGIGSIFPPAPSISVSLKGLKKGGDLYVKFTQTKSKISATVESDKVNLEQLNVAGLAEPIGGILNVDGYLSLDQNDTSKSAGNLDLSIEKLKIPAQNAMGFLLPVTNVGPGKIKLNIKNGVGEINTFQLGAKDSDLQGTASGDLRLGKQLMTSFLNLALRIQLAERYKQNPQSSSLTSLLNSFKSSKGDYGMKWSASFQDMSTNVMSAIPQRIPD